jgi:hypothetical protein
MVMILKIWLHSMDGRVNKLQAHDAGTCCFQRLTQAACGGQVVIQGAVASGGAVQVFGVDV